MGIKTLLFMTILAFGLGQLPAAYAMMYQDEETVSSLKRLNEKISNKTKISSVVKIIKEENIEELYKNLSINDKARVNLTLADDSRACQALSTQGKYRSCAIPK